MENGRSKDSLDGVTNGVSKVDEVAQASLALVDGDYVRLDSDRARNNRQQELLCVRACRLGTPCKVRGGGLDSSEYLGGPGLEGRKLCFVPDGRGLRVALASPHKHEGTLRLTLTTSAIPFENSRAGSVSKNAASMKMYSGCQNAPMRFFPWGVSMAVLPPTLESTMARSVVGIWTNRTPRMLDGHLEKQACLNERRYVQGRRHETHKISNNAASESENDGVARALVEQEEVFDLRLAFAYFFNF